MKFLLTTVLLFAASQLLQAAPDLSSGRPGPTPYDRYLEPVDSVLHQLDGSAPSLAKVSALMRQGFAFKYVFDVPYTAALPSVTSARHAGDCKAKSLWLASEMNDPTVKFVIGKARRTSKISHAWLMWKNGGHWWILDPTNASKPIPAEAVGSDEYLVFYSYDQNGSYCHNSPSVLKRMIAGRD